MKFVLISVFFCLLDHLRFRAFWIFTNNKQRLSRRLRIKYFKGNTLFLGEAVAEQKGRFIAETGGLYLCSRQVATFVRKKQRADANKRWKQKKGWAHYDVYVEMSEEALLARGERWRSKERYLYGDNEAGARKRKCGSLRLWWGHRWLSWHSMWDADSLPLTTLFQINQKIILWPWE